MVTYYVGGHEAIYQPDGSSEIKRYIRDIAIHTIKSSGSQSLHYVFNDHLGSGSVITDADGNIVETASFDAFGKRRNANSWQGYTNPFSQLPNLAALLNITQKGYTGHIQVDHAAVIHMGGRIYDPDLGRFMQADPIVQDPRDAQSLNRYSYVFNNPLSYTDPTGYDCNNLKGKPCNSALEQQKEDAVKAAQTQGVSKTEDVSKGNQSANLQNAAKVASGNSSFWSGLFNGALDGALESAWNEPLNPLAGINESAADFFGASYTSPLDQPVTDAAQLGKDVAPWAVMAIGLISRNPKGVADAGSNTFEYFMKKADQLDVSTARNSAVFYSGPGNRELAESFARLNGKITLEMTSGGEWLDDAKLFSSNSPLSPSQAAQVWSRLSQRYAEGASGNVVGFAEGSRRGSIFNSVEYPTLLENRNVTNVITGGH